MGIVYLARDLSLDRRVAIKLLPQELVAEPLLRERFLREARLAARLSHPNIVPVYSVEEHPDAVFYVMGFIAGESLAQRIARAGNLAPAEVTTILQQTAWALAYAHGNGVVHRDIKPDNVLLEQGTGRAYVMDFGIARALDAAGGRDGGRPAATRLTQVGHVVGTAAYMSPEQAAGEEVDGRSDLYSLGVMAYQALAGRLPFEATSAQVLLTKHLTEVPAPVASLRPGTPGALAKVVDQLLAKDPSARPQTGGEVAEQLSGAGGVAGEIPAPLRDFIRAADGELGAVIRFMAVILAILLATAKVGLPSIIAVSTAGLATVAGSTAALFFRVRRLASLGYRWVDVSEAIALDARARAEEARQLGAPPSPEAVRRAGWIALVSFAIGAGVFVGAILLLTKLGEARAIGRNAGLAIILAATAVNIISILPLAYWAAMRRGASRPVSDDAKPTPALRLLAGWLGPAMFRLATSGTVTQAPRGAAAAMDLLLGEVGQKVARHERRHVERLRAALLTLAQRAEALRARERELDRAIAEAGPGPAADALARARAEVGPAQERIARLTEEARQGLLLVRTGVAAAGTLDALAPLDK